MDPRGDVPGPGDAGREAGRDMRRGDEIEER